MTLSNVETQRPLDQGRLVLDPEPAGEGSAQRAFATMVTLGTVTLGAVTPRLDS